MFKKERGGGERGLESTMMMMDQVLLNAPRVKPQSFFDNINEHCLFLLHCFGH